MKKILIISFIPYPLKAGGQVAQFAVLEKLQHVMDVTFCAVLFSKENEALLAPLQQLLPKATIISAFNGVVSQPKSSKKKIIQWLRKLKSGATNKSITQTHARDDFYDTRTSVPFDLKREYFIQEIQQICNKQKFDIIQTEFHPFLELVNLLPVNIPKVFVAHESRYLRLQSSYAESKASEVYKAYILERNRLYEVALLQKYSAVITFSQHDQQALTKEGLQNVHAIPFPIIDADFLPNKVYEQPKQLVYIGNQGHTPNLEGLIWYLKHCHEKVVQQFHLPLVVIGNWTIQQEILAQYNHVSFVGSVETIDPYYEKAILLAPIFSGSGIRTKILYGMAKKTPVISTDLGCQGLGTQHLEHLHIANTPDQLLQAVQFMLQNPTHTNQMVQQAFNLVHTNYNQEIILQQRMHLYQQLC